MTREDRSEFIRYLRQCTDAQVRGVYDNERTAKRRAYMQLAKDEAARRGIEVAS